MTRYTPQAIGVSSDNVVTLRNKTIDGDDNTLRDIATTSVKANNAGRVIVSGVMNPTLTVSPITITELNKLDGILSDAVGVNDTQILTNKSISDPFKVDIIDSYTSGDAVVIKELSIGDRSELQISDGVITITQGFHQVISQDLNPDDLTSILGGTIGQVLVIRGGNPTYLVTIKDQTNIRIAGDFSFAGYSDCIMLINSGSNIWYEISRSTNG